MAKNDFNKIDINRIAKDAAKKTDEKLASQISSLTVFNDEEIKKLFPKQGDVALFTELMQIVHSADKRNKKVEKIVENSEKFAGIVLDVFSKII